MDLPAPRPSENEILVELYYSLISTGTELAGLQSTQKSLLTQALEDPKKILRGLEMVRKKGFRQTRDAIKGEVEGAISVGYSASGVVLACGQKVERFAVGDRVACGGAGKANHAEIIAVPQNLAVRIPDGCDFESGASGTVGAIAMQGVRRAEVRLGESVAVLGLGLVGQLTVQLLKASGCRVIGSDPDENRISLAKSLGMSAGTNPKDDDTVRQVWNFSGQRGVDAVIITASSSSKDLVQQAMQMVRKKGRVVVVGAVPLEMERAPFYEKEADFLISCSYGPGRYDPEYEERGLDYPYAYVRWTENRNMEEYLRLVADKQIDFRALVDGIFPIAEAERAYASLSRLTGVAVLLSMSSGNRDDKLVSRVQTTAVSASPSGRIRVGLIGPGSFARSVHLPNVKRLNDTYELTAIAGRSGPSAWNAAQQYGARYVSTSTEDLLKDPDIDSVLICSRHDVHSSLAAQAIRAGKAVFLEKPAALNPEQLEQLVTAVREHNGRLMVGFNRRFSPFIAEIRRLVKERANPLFISYRMNVGEVSPDSWVQGSEGGGRIIGECCHIFDLFNCLVGHLPVEVSALALRPSSERLLATDNFSAILKYPDGSLCTLLYSAMGSTALPKEKMELSFDGKTFVLDDYRELKFFGSSRKDMTTIQQEKGHLEELTAFADYLKGKTPPPMSLEEIESATRISFAVNDLVRN